MIVICKKDLIVERPSSINITFVAGKKYNYVMSPTGKYYCIDYCTFYVKSNMTKEFIRYSDNLYFEDYFMTLQEERKHKIKLLDV